MLKVGDNITQLRKQRNMTQAELGRLLNISAQAVSKWENGLSEPDIETSKKLCEIFEITLDELVGLGGNVKNDKPESQESEDDAQRFEEKQKQREERAINSVPNGVCNVCGKTIYGKVYYVCDKNDKSTSVPYCEKCKRKRDTVLNINESKERKKIEQTNAERFQTNIRRGLITGGIFGVIAFIVTLIVSIVSARYAFCALSIVVGYGILGIVSQCFWDGPVLEVFEFFLRSFNMPGLIFTLDLDGIIWFITVKLAFMVLSALLSVLLFLIGVLVALVVALFTFPYCLKREIRQRDNSLYLIDKLEKEINGYQESLKHIA